MNKMNKMNINTVSDDEIQDLFEEAFREQVGKWNNIEEFDVKCSREVSGNCLKVSVEIQGLAGCPNAEDFKNNKLKNVSTVNISRADKGGLTFSLLPKETVYLNSTEYIVVYKSN